MPSTIRNLFPAANLKRSPETFQTKFCATTMYVKHVSCDKLAFLLKFPLLQYTVLALMNRERMLFAAEEVSASAQPAQSSAKPRHCLICIAKQVLLYVK